LPLAIWSDAGYILNRFEFADKFNPPRLYRISLRNFESHDRFINIPLYAIGLFPQLR